MEYLESKLSTVVVHTTGVHEAKDITYIRGVQNLDNEFKTWDPFSPTKYLLSCCWTNTPIGQGGAHHSQGLRIDLQATRLEIQVQAVVKVQVFREAVVLLEKI